MHKHIEVEKTITKRTTTTGQESYIVTFTKFIKLPKILGGKYKICTISDRIVFNSYEVAKDYIDNVNCTSTWTPYEDLYYRTKYMVYLNGIIRLDEIKKSLTKFGFTDCKILYDYTDTNRYPKCWKISATETLTKKVWSLYGNNLTNLITKFLNEISYTDDECITIVSRPNSFVPKDVKLSKIEQKRKELIESEIKRIDEYKNQLRSLL